MLLENILSPELIKVEIEAQDKDAVFKELVDFYCKADNSPYGDDILKAIQEREAKMSTGISKGIAFPHGKTNTVDTIRVVIGISKKGILYDSLDGEPVYLLFMIISPIEDSQNHLRLLKRLADLIETPLFFTELQSQNDPQSAFETICKFEKMLKK